MESKISNLKFVSFESRQSDAMQAMIQKQGGVCFSAPTLREVPLESNSDLDRFTRMILAHEVDVIIFLTGVGASKMIEIMSAKLGLEKVRHELSITTIVTRGPKPIKALSAFGIKSAIRVGEPNTWRQVIQDIDEDLELGGVKGKTVAIQEYGTFNQELIDGLSRRGAKVIRVPVYRWALPDDIEPIKIAIQKLANKEVDVALFTSAVQIHHLFQVAIEHGLEASLRSGFEYAVVASIGPMCSEGIESHGVQIDFEAEKSSMGAFVLDLVNQAQACMQTKRQKKNTRVINAPSLISSSVKAEFTHSPFMKALRLEKSDVTPIWLMRQAGRYMKEYREIRKGIAFLEFCKRPDLVTEITVKARQLLDADAAIIFSDILVIIESFGLDLEYGKHQGPAIQISLDEGMSVDDIELSNVDESLAFVFEAVRQTRAALEPNIPLLGFCGAPFTIASYMIEGGSSKTFQRTKAYMYQDMERWNVLMQKITDGLIKLLEGQIHAGAQAVQIFDSWVGCMDTESYRKYVFKHSKRLIDSVKSLAPVIHFGTGNPQLLPAMTEAGGNCIGVDFRMNMKDAWQQIGYDRSIQGNLDPAILLTNPPTIKQHVQEILNQTKGHPGHIFNLGHGILPETPFEHARYLVDLVHDLSRKTTS